MTDPGRSPTPLSLLMILLAAVAVRAAALQAVAVKTHASWSQVPYSSDGVAYLDNAKRINGDGMPSDYDRRAFVGFPWMIAMLHRLGLPYGAAGLGLGLLLPGVLAAVMAVWLRDSRIGWAMAILPPHHVTDTAGVMNETSMVLLCVLATALLRWRWIGVTLAAALFAAAGMVRPMACFAVVGAIVLLLQSREHAKAVVLSIATLAILAALYLLFRHFYWDPLDSVRQYDAHPEAYDGHLFSYPFGSFVERVRAGGALRFNFLYKLLYLAAAFAVLALAVVAWKRSRRPLDAWALAWWSTNLAFVLCIGSHWGVDIFHRAIMWAAPAGYWTLRDYLPTHWGSRLIWALLPVALVFVISV
jgi:hypothetical protein